MDKLDVITCISKNSADYAELLKKTGDHFASGNIDISYKFVESIDSERNPKGWKKLAKVGRSPEDQNSMNHSVALNRAMDFVENKTIIIDADIAILYPNWDEVVLKMLKFYSCWGGSYCDIVNHRYMKFPCVYFFCINPEIKKHHLDFSPLLKNDSPAKITIQDTINEAIFKRRIGSTIKCDTGWTLPINFHNTNSSHNYMESFSSIDQKCKLPFKNDKQKGICKTKPEHMCEWHYQGHIFATHKQASRSHSLYGTTWGKIWLERINLYCKKFGVQF